MTYFDVFLLLKYGVLIAMAIAISLAVTLVIRNLLRRTEPGPVISQEQRAPESVEASTEAKLEAPAEPAAAVEVVTAPDKPVVSDVSVTEASGKPARNAEVPSPQIAETPVIPQKLKQVLQRRSNISIQQLLTEVEGEPVYQVADSLLNAQERAFFSALKPVLPEHLTLMCKVRAADFLSVNQDISKGDSFGLMKLISTQYVTFLVCDKQTLDPVGFIELHDLEPRHLMAREARLNVLRHLSQEVDFPMVVLDLANGYQMANLVQHLNRLTSSDSVHHGQPVYRYLSGKIAPEQPRQEKTAPAKSSDKCCPECGSQMSYRISRSGKYKGRVFHACQSYPTCNHIKLMPVVSNSGAVSQKVKQFA